MWYNNEKIVSFKLIEENNTIEIVKQISSNIVYGNGEKCPDDVYKEIYGVVEGNIQLIEKIKGTHIPSHFVPEKITF